MRRLIALALLCLSLTACLQQRPPAPLAELPPLRLVPAALGHELSVQQKLHFRFGTQQRELDALLEVDASEVRLAVQALGQTGVNLRWDGTELHQQRASWLPETVRGERVLDDLQFVLWPADAIRAALPPDWRLEEQGGERRLLHGDTVWLSATRLDAQRVRLENFAERYSLEIESADVGAPGP
ncbi:DUF3261 domain-containing protein [Pseudoxanthomonas sp. UTMC 1351]|uniref:DUF3261 domain-containing protein n=1 Tax=Pseudoxanthomonas sp. UTMC 1351 TaxID=2695853 RepID=UPI0034CE4C4B